MGPALTDAWGQAHEARQAPVHGDMAQLMAHAVDVKDACPGGRSQELLRFQMEEHVRLAVRPQLGPGRVYSSFERRLGGHLESVRFIGLERLLQDFAEGLGILPVKPRISDRHARQFYGLEVIWLERRRLGLVPLGHGHEPGLGDIEAGEIGPGPEVQGLVAGPPDLHVKGIAPFELVADCLLIAVPADNFDLFTCKIRYIAPAPGPGRIQGAIRALDDPHLALLDTVDSQFAVRGNPGGPGATALNLRGAGDEFAVRRPTRADAQRTGVVHLTGGGVHDLERVVLGVSGAGADRQLPRIRRPGSEGFEGLLDQQLHCAGLRLKNKQAVVLMVAGPPAASEGHLLAVG